MTPTTQNKENLTLFYDTERRRFQQQKNIKINLTISEERKCHNNSWILLITDISC